MDNITIIKNLKSAETGRYKYPLYDNHKSEVGYCIPINNQLADDDTVAELISQWRNENSYCFQTIFKSTKERTKKWLKESILNDDKRILFLIYNMNDKLIGHVGFKDIESETAFGDNLMVGDKQSRGLSGFYVVITNCKFGFEVLNLKEINASILESNKMSLFVNEKLGFEVTDKVPLVKKMNDAGDVLLVEDVNASEYADVNVHLTLKKENFKY